MKTISMRGSAGKRLQRLDRRADPEVDALGHPGTLPVLPGDGGSLVTGVAGEQASAGGEAPAMQIDE
jgi:hypothetical protein